MTDPKRVSAMDIVDGTARQYEMHLGVWPEYRLALIAAIEAAEVAAYKLGRENASKLTDPAAERAAVEALITEALPISQHHVADEFWRAWNENGERHKHGFYESTWMSLRAALTAALKPLDAEEGDGE